MRIFPYGLARTIGERFESAAQQGFLISDEQGYRATEQGKSINQQGLNALTNSIAHINPISSIEFQKLIDYLVRLVESSISAPEPPPKFCITHYMNYNNTFSSEAPLSSIFVHHFKELDFYRMDSHMAAWRIHNIEGNLWEVFSEVWGGKNNTLDKLYEELSFRGITRDEYAQILHELVKQQLHQPVSPLAQERGGYSRGDGVKMVLDIDGHGWNGQTLDGPLLRCLAGCWS